MESADHRSIGQRGEVAPDVLRVSLPLPSPRLPEVNAYLMRAGDGWVLIDSGSHEGASRDLLREGLRSIGGPEQVREVWLTHLHADHYGGVTELDGATPGIRYDERDRDVPGRTERLAEAASHWTAHGAPQPFAEEVTAWYRAQRAHAVPPLPRTKLPDADTMRVGARRAQALHTPGHTPGHLVFYEPDAELLFTGDLVLPHETPHVGVWPGELSNPLQRYLEALARVRRLRVRRALPGHGDPIDNLDGRIAEILEHHARRLADAERVVREGGSDQPPSTYEVASAMTWSTPWSRLGLRDRVLALTEAHAHLWVLDDAGRVQRVRTRGDEGPTVRWQRRA